LKLLIATDHFPPFIGGGQRWASLLARGLARRGHEVSVATVWHGGLPRVEHHGEPAVPVHRIRQLRTPLPALIRDRRQRHTPPFPDPLSIRDLRRVVRAAEPEVVLSHGWISFSVAAALTGTRIPLAISVHEYGYFCATRMLLHDGYRCSGPAPTKCLACAGRHYGPVKGSATVLGVGLSKPLIARRIDAVQSVTSFVDGEMARHLLGGRRAARAVQRFVIPAFVHEAADRGEIEERDLAEILARLPEEPFVLFVGAFRAAKGLGVLFEAHRRLERRPPLVLIGTMERDTPRFPEEAIVITDAPHRVVTAAMDRALLLAVPSLLPEPLATVAVEGISRGLPTIATVPSGLPDVLGDDAGILVPQGDAEALAQAMQSIIDGPELRRRLGRAAAARAERFQAEAVLSRYEQMLERLRQEPFSDAGAP
jgi:glycosyltransferase involved in cell wall biosynthesis